MILGPIAFMLGKRPALLSRSSGGSLAPLCLISTASKSPWLWTYLKLSFFFSPIWLIELGSMEITTLNPQAKIGYLSWYVFELGPKQRLLVFKNGKSVSSLEGFFRNGRWLEREASEMVGVFFKGKRDRRVLFGLPVFYTNPLRRAFPTGGLFDLGVCPLTSKLVFRHISWLS